MNKWSSGGMILSNVLTSTMFILHIVNTAWCHFTSGCIYRQALLNTFGCGQIRSFCHRKLWEKQPWCVKNFWSLGSSWLFTFFNLLLLTQSHQQAAVRFQIGQLTQYRQTAHHVLWWGSLSNELVWQEEWETDQLEGTWYEPSHTTTVDRPHLSIAKFYGYRIIGDNIDKHVKLWDMTNEHHVTTLFSFLFSFKFTW